MIEKPNTGSWRGWLVIILLGILGWSLTSNYLQHSYTKELLTQSTIDHSKFSKWKDSIGREHAKIKIVTEYITQLQPEVKQKLDATAKNLGIAAKDILQYTEVASYTKGSFNAKIDTNKTFVFSDRYLSFDGKIKDDSLGGTYTYSDTVYYTSHKDKKKFLGITVKSDPVLDVHFGNPNTTISGVTNVVLKDYIKPKKFGIGPNVGATYYDGKIRPYIGIGIQYNLIRF